MQGFGRVALGIAAAAAVGLSGWAAQAAGPPAVLYRHVTLIDGAGTPARRDMAVLVEGQLIKAVGPDAQVTAAAPPDARAVDLTGKFLLPGLIDSHEHMATPPNRPQAEASLRRDLYGGVTAVRDMADDLRAVGELTRASLAGEIPAPDIYYAALMAGPSFFVDPRTHAATFGVTPGKAPWMQAIDHATDLREAVTLARGTSATAVKIYANLPGDLVKAIAAEAHRQGLRVWTHSAVFPATPQEVLDAHPDTVSHTCYMAYQVVGVPDSYQHKTPIDPKPFAGGDNPVMAGLFAQMKAQGTILDATVYVYREGEENHAENPGSPPPYCSLDLAVRLTRQAWKAGVAISTGTDAVAPWDDPWPTLYGELELLVGKVGMSPAEAIHAATEVSARAAGQDAIMGTVEAGKLANLIVLDRDPLADIGALRSLDFTVKRGREYRRADYRPITRTEFKDAD